MPFQIIDVETGAFVESPLAGVPIQYETGDGAQNDAKARGILNGRKYRVKRVLDTAWRDREQAKFNNGTYTPLPWANDTWWRMSDAQKIRKDQFPHVSKTEPGMVAYIANDEKGMDNIHTRVKPGRYLEQFREVAEKYGIDLRLYAKQFEQRYSVKTLFFAATEDEIQDVYECGPASCMSSEAYRKKHGWGYPGPGGWPEGKHACRAYAAGDLQVAYLREDDARPKSKIIARALVWPEKKTHSRCYGDETRIKLMLGAAGYTFGPPIGAKLLRFPFKRQFIVPYIDQGFQSGQGSLAIKDMKTHLMIVTQTPGTYPANATSGLSGGRYMADGSLDDGAGVCSVCEEEHDTVRVYTGGAPGDYAHWCHDCIDDNGGIYQCATNGRYYTEDVPRVVMYNGETWANVQFIRNGFTCLGNGQHYPLSQRCTVKLTPQGKSAFWSRDYVQDHAFRCDYTGDCYALDQKVEMKNGCHWSKQAVAHAGFTCTDCGGVFSVHEASKPGEHICGACAAKKVPPGPPGPRRKLKESNTDPDAAMEAIIAALTPNEEHARD
jgi:hypothetical protein